jgi:methylenetetrahydrofolate dehydrogenase (NADP+)/methenyltetrahydrofolate cyclohydrolase
MEVSQRKTAEIIDGRAIAGEVRSELKKRIETLRERNIIPGLAVILAGDDPASHVYVRMKKKASVDVGIFNETFEYPSSVTEEEIITMLLELNQNDKVHGILVQLPLPGGIDTKKVLETVDPAKDVDGFHPTNVGRLVVGEKVLKPCTPAGIQELLKRKKIDTRGKHVVIVGRSNVVGRPLANMLSLKAEMADATVTLCHSRTESIESHTLQADILIAAIGRAEFVNGSMIKEGAVVIDVGVNRVDDPGSEKGYRLAGDVHFESAVRVAGAITPVPGGVGPMTIAMLMNNTVQAAENSLET